MEGTKNKRVSHLSVSLLMFGAKDDEGLSCLQLLCQDIEVYLKNINMSFLALFFINSV